MLYLVRHGRTAHNATRRLLGRLDLPLDELGVRQAAALSSVPALHDATRGVARPLKRAQETAALLGPPVATDDRWVEMDYGGYDGMPLDEVPADVWESWLGDPAWTPEGGESHLDLETRVQAACEDLWPEAAETDVIVVSHVSPIKAAVTWALGVPVTTARRMHLDTASVCRLAPGRGGRPALVTFNDISGRPSA